MVDKSQAAQTLQQRIASLSPAQQQLFRKQLEAKGIPWEQAIAASTEKTSAPKKKAPTRPEQLPLSASQKHLWVLHQLYPETTAYHISLVLSMRGALAIPVLKQSLQAIVNRHESLRTVFLQGDNQPYAKLLPSLELDFQTVDLTAVPPLESFPSEKTEGTAISAASKHHRELLSQQPFDLEKGPLIRARLLRLEDINFELILVLHHLIADGWSRGILLRELAGNYRHYLQQEALQEKAEQPLAPLLTPLKFQYADYVLQQQQWLQGNDYQQQRAYWQEQLAGLPELTLPTDGIAGTDFTSQICTLSFSKEQTLAIKALAKQLGATVFMLLLSTFKLLLQRYSAQRDIAVGIPVAGRNTSAVEELIGFFVNTLVLRSQIDLNHAFPDWLKQVQATLADALQHQDIPFSEVVDAVGAARIPGKNPLFRVMFQVQSAGYQLQNAQQLDLGMPGLSLSQQWVEPSETKFDMSWHVIERDGELLVAVEYRTQLFKEVRVAQMLRHFHNLVNTVVNAVVDNPDQKLSQFSLLSDEEREQILTQWSQGESVDTPIHFLPDRFEQQVKVTPNAIAVADRASQSALTYQQLNHRANKLAHWLRNQGIGVDVGTDKSADKGDSEKLVGICLSPGIDLMTALLATLKAGGAYIPLDPALPADRVRYMVTDAEPTVLIGHSDCLDVSLAREVSATVFFLDKDEQMLIAQPGTNLANQLTSQSLAYVIYTSGSTGKPKGTQLTHGGLINYLNWCLKAYPITEGCGAPVQSSIGFDATITSLFSPLLAGKQVVFGLGETEGKARDKAESVTEIEALQAALSEGFSLIKLTPAHLSALQPLLCTQEIQRDRLPKALIIGGEALHSHHVSVWKEHYPEVKLFNEYGPTEAVVGCCVHQVKPDSTQGTIPEGIPIGRPIDGVQLYILDKNQQPLPAGVPGELYIGGEGVARGYLDQPALTAERFVKNESLNDSVLYKTGDLAVYRNDGTIDYLGRIDNQIKLRGFRIEPGEIENSLCLHSQVSRAVVLLREDGNKRELVAYVVSADDTDASDSSDNNPELTAALYHQLKQALPSYMVPSHIVVLRELPLTPNGKIDRRSLPAPSVGITGDAESRPRDRKETVLLEIWQQILNRDEIGIHDNFFDLGGDSISGMQIVSKAHEQGLKLTPTQLFEHQTIAEQAAIALEQSSGNRLATPPTGLIPLSPIQQNFFDQAPANPHHYNQAVMVSVRSETETTTLHAALEKLAEHHDSLRLRFENVDGSWQQQYPSAASVPLDKIDFTHTEESRSVNQSIDEIQKSFHLTNGPLFRGSLLTLQSGKFLLLVAHHLVVDGVSWRILLNDLRRAYHQVTHGETVTLPSKTTAFGHWTRHLASHAPAFEAERDYWIDVCQSVPSLPADSPSGDNTVGDTREIVVSLTSQETTLLKALKQPVPTLLLCAIAQTIQQWSQSNTLVVDMEGHGRHVWDESLELSRTVGWFTALYPLRLSLPSASLKEQLSAVQHQLDKVPNGGVGYGLLRSTEAALTSPAEISFNYLGQLAIETAGFITGLDSDTVPAVQSSTKSPESDRKYHFEIVALIQDDQLGNDQLQIRWRYSNQQYQQSTLTQLTHRFVNNLKSLLADCKEDNKASSSTMPRFAAAQVDTSQLNQLMSKLKAREGKS